MLDKIFDFFEEKFGWIYGIYVFYILVFVIMYGIIYLIGGK